MYTDIEDVIEILSGHAARKINIRLDSKDRIIIKSIQRQIFSNLGLTDRQLYMILKKIEKYRDGLQQNSVDVDGVLSNPTTRLPLRQIDRTNTLEIFKNTEKNQKSFIFKHQKNPEISQKWREASKELVGPLTENYSQKIFPCVDFNLKIFCNTFNEFEIIFDEDTSEMIEEMEKILRERDQYVPRLIKNTDGYQILNFKSSRSENLQLPANENDFKTISAIKNLGIELDQSVLDDFVHKDQLAYKILKENSTTFRIKPNNFSINSLIEAICILGQYPLMIVVESDGKVLDTVNNLFNILKEKISENEITVFFRLNSNHEKNKDFAEYIKTNKLNNFVDHNTKVVIIDRQRISKPLLKSQWHAKSAIVISPFEYGKISVLLNDIQNVYYYNDSFFYLRRDRIAEL